MTGPELAALRKELGLSVLRAARRIGVGERTVRRWENGSLKPIPADVALRLARKNNA
jgi:DNA-binding transcriptional regulator YiaG